MSYALIDNDVIQLCCAVRTGDISDVKILLEAGVDINGQDRNEETALHTAVYNEEVDIVKELIDSAADVNLANKNGQTPLHLAASCGNSNLTRLLLGARVDIESKTKYTEMTALHIASQNGHTDTVRALVEHGANIDTLDVINKPADFYASNSEIIDIFKCEKMVLQTENENKTKNNEEGEIDLMQKYLQPQRINGQQPQKSVANDKASIQNTSVEFRKDNTVEIQVPREKEHPSVSIMKTHTQTKPTPTIQTNVRPTPVNTNNMPGRKSNLTTTTKQRTLRLGKTRILPKPATNHKTKVLDQKPARVQFSQQHEKIMQMNVFDRLTKKPQLKK